MSRYKFHNPPTARELQYIRRCASPDKMREAHDEFAFCLEARDLSPDVKAKIAINRTAAIHLVDMRLDGLRLRTAMLKAIVKINDLTAS